MSKDQPNEPKDTFFDEDLGDKPVKVLLGKVVDAFEKALNRRGFTTAKEVLGVFLTLGKDENKFKIWW